MIAIQKDGTTYIEVLASDANGRGEVISLYGLPEEKTPVNKLHGKVSFWCVDGKDSVWLTTKQFTKVMALIYEMRQEIIDDE